MEFGAFVRYNIEEIYFTGGMSIVKKIVKYSIVILMLFLTGCGESPVDNDEEITVSEEISTSAETNTVDQKSENYSEEDMYAVCNSLNKVLTSQWESVGVRVNCYPTLENDSILIVALIDSVDKTLYTDEELLKLLQDNNIEEGFIKLPASIMEDYKLKNVVLDLADKNGKMLYLFYNGDKIFQVGDESYDLAVELITRKEK